MNRETIMAALYQRLQRPPLFFSFTADLTAGDPTLYNISDTSGLVVGMPLFGNGVAPAATVAGLDPAVMSAPAASGGFGLALGQGIATSSRRLQPWTSVKNQPALFLVGGHNLYPGISGREGRLSNTPARITLEPVVWIYANVPDPNALPETTLNALLDAFEKTLDPDPATDNGVWLNLGLQGVIHCRIEGRVLINTGPIDGQAVAQIPLAVEVVQSVDTVPL